MRPYSDEFKGRWKSLLDYKEKRKGVGRLLSDLFNSPPFSNGYDDAALNALTIVLKFDPKNLDTIGQEAMRKVGALVDSARPIK
jgi:hypothetical protein